MTSKRLHHHFLPHIHENPPSHKATEGMQHQAHLVSLTSLFVYLQVFVLLMLGVLVIRVKAPQILGTASFSAEQIINLTNAKRAANGAPALLANSLLSSAASAKAADMLSANYWSHNSPSGKTPWSFISTSGYKYIYAGENLARDFGDPQSVVDAWMNSSSHKKNLLDADFKEIGVAVVSGKLTGRDGILVVQMFGTPVSQVPTSKPLVSTSPTPVASPLLVAGAVSPKPTVAREAEPSASPVASPVSQVADVSSDKNQETLVLASRKFELVKFSSFFLIAAIFGLFLIEVLVVTRKKHLSLRPQVVAHVLLLGFVLFALWYAVGGAVL